MLIEKIEREVDDYVNNVAEDYGYDIYTLINDYIQYTYTNEFKNNEIDINQYILNKIY